MLKELKDNEEKVKKMMYEQNGDINKNIKNVKREGERNLANMWKQNKCPDKQSVVYICVWCK